MEYIDVQWLHQNSQDPIRLVSEVDAQRYEIRKLEFFRNGVVGYASKLSATDGTSLGELPIPSLAEINMSPEFNGLTITKAAFEALWQSHAPGRV
jgi:hypothetical protein